MRKSLVSLQPKLKPNIFYQQNLEAQFSTIEHQSSTIDNVEPIFEDQLKLSTPKQSHPKPDSAHLEIELDDGKIQLIFPKASDNPFELAEKFCLKHQLDEEMLLIVTQNITKTIAKIKSNQNPKQQTRFITEPAQLCLKKQNSFRHVQNTKRLISESRRNMNKPDLFYRCFRQESQKKHWIQKQKQLKSTIELNQCTHSPQINKISQKICNIKPHYKSSKRQHTHQSKSVRTQASVQIQPFAQKRTLDLYSNRQNQLYTVFDYLYQNGKNKQIKRKQKLDTFLKKNCNFQPQINQTSRKIVGNRSFEQIINTSKKASVKQSQNKSILSSVENSKGSVLEHHPKVGAFKQYCKPITYSLNNLAKNPQKIASNPKFNPSSKLIVKKSAFHYQQTQKLYQNQKKKAFKSIFQLLDEDGDGAISILDINLINGIEQKLIQVLFPVLEELEILQTQLNQMQFCKAMEKLFCSLSVEEKGYLLKYCHRAQKQQRQRLQTQPSKPKMTPVSSILVNQTDRSNVSIYQYSKLRQELKQQKLEQQRILKQRSVMRNCTFHPKTNPKKPIYF